MTPVLNQQGQTALKYHQPGQPYLQNTPSGQEYIGVTKANICMIWANAEDVDHILAKRGGCCGGKKRLFAYANEDDVRRWTNGGGR